MGGLQRSTRAAAAKSQGKQTALKAVSKQESAAAKSPIPLADPAARASAVGMTFKVGCGM